MKKSPKPDDIFAGSQLRTFRKAKGWSQEKIGDAVGLTFQQIQKYEKGGNRMGASRLNQFARLLDVPVASFFREAAKPGEEMTAEVEAISKFTGSRDGIALIRAFGKLSPAVRTGFVHAIEAAAGGV